MLLKQEKLETRHPEMASWELLLVCSAWYIKQVTLLYFLVLWSGKVVLICLTERILQDYLLSPACLYMELQKNLQQYELFLANQNALSIWSNNRNCEKLLYHLEPPRVCGDRPSPCLYTFIFCSYSARETKNTFFSVITTEKEIRFKA